MFDNATQGTLTCFLSQCFQQHLMVISGGSLLNCYGVDLCELSHDDHHLHYNRVSKWTLSRLKKHLVKLLFQRPRGNSHDHLICFLRLRFEELNCSLDIQM